jgi:hypothetical protein
MGEIMKTLVKIVAGLCFLGVLAHADTEWIQLGAYDEPVPIEVNLVESSDDHILFEVFVHGFNTEDVQEYVGETLTTFQRITIPESECFLDPGDPSLPYSSELFAAPNNATFDIDVLYDEYTTLEDYYVLPAYEWSEVWGGDYEFTINNGNGEVYATDDFFPDDAAELGLNSENQYLMAQRLVSANYTPFEFNPIDEELRVHTYSLIEIDITASGGSISWNEDGVGPYEEMLASAAPNYEIVSHSAPGPNSPSLYKFTYAAWDQNEDYFEEAQCDYLVIAAETFADMITPGTPPDSDLENLLKWRSTDNDSPNGFDIMVAPLDEIVKWWADDEDAERENETNYDVAIAVDDFIEEVYTLSTAPHIPGGMLGYVLIVGDSHSMKGNVPGESGDNFQAYDVTEDYEVPTVIVQPDDVDFSGTYPVFSDLPYACIDTDDLFYPEGGSEPSYNEDDYSPEIRLGRITADNTLTEDDDQSDNRTATEVMNDIAAKIMDYEKNTIYSDAWRYRNTYYDGHYVDYDVFKFYNDYNPGLDHYIDQMSIVRDILEIDAYDIGEYDDFEDLVDDCRDDLIDMLDAGPVVGNDSERIFIFGTHGLWNGIVSKDGVSQLYVLDNDNVEEINVYDDHPMIFAWSCSTANFCEGFNTNRDDGDESGLDNRCFGETWLRRVDNGAIAYYGATVPVASIGARKLHDIIYSNFNEELGKLWLSLIYTRESFGDALKTSFAYVLLGDPACSIGDERIEPDRPNLVVSWANVYYSDLDNNPSDGDWPYINYNSPKELNVSVAITNTGGSATPSTTSVTFDYYSYSPKSQIGTDSYTLPILSPGETKIVYKECEFSPLVPEGDWDKEFVVEITVSPSGLGETFTGDNVVMYPDDDTSSYSGDTFEKTPVTFYDLVPGMPISVCSTINEPYTTTEWHVSPIVVFDIDGDGCDEIIAMTTQGQIAVFTYDDEEDYRMEKIQGWPIKINSPQSVISVGNLNGSGNEEIVVRTGATAPVFITAYEIDADEYWNTPLSVPGVDTPLIVADLDGSVGDEIIFGAGDYLYCYNGDKTAYTGWGSAPNYGQIYVGCSVDGLCLADVDKQTNQPEVIYTSSEGEIGCYNYQGYQVFVQTTLTYDPNRAPLVAELSGSGEPEVLYTKEYASGVRALDSDGSTYTFNANVESGQIVGSDMSFGTVGSGGNAQDMVAITTMKGRFNAWDTFPYRDITAGPSWVWMDYFTYPPLIADVDGQNGPDLIGVWNDQLAYAFDYAGADIDPFPFTLYESVSHKCVPAVGDIDGDGDAELIFGVGKRIVAINLDGDADDIEWGQFHHDAAHTNSP